MFAPMSRRARGTVIPEKYLMKTDAGRGSPVPVRANGSAASTPMIMGLVMMPFASSETESRLPPRAFRVRMMTETTL